MEPDRARVSSLELFDRHKETKCSPSPAGLCHAQLCRRRSATRRPVYEREFLLAREESRQGHPGEFGFFALAGSISF